MRATYGSSSSSRWRVRYDLWTKAREIVGEGATKTRNLAEHDNTIGESTAVDTAKYVNGFRSELYE
jgi:hypothetical protein